MKKEHILIMRFSALGDVAMAVPVVFSLAKAYPDVRITVLSRGFARALFEDLAPNVSFMEADMKREYHGLRGLNALYRRLTAKNFTAIADFHDVMRSKYLRARFNIDRYRVAHIDKHREGRRRLTAANGRCLQQQPTSFENYADVLAQLGYPVKLDFHSIFPPEGGNMNLLPAVFAPKKRGEEWIGIAPFAGHEGKIYPIALMETVVRQLAKRHPNARLFLFGRGANEDKVFPEWCKQTERCVYVGKHLETLHQELILMSHLDVMLSMDSSNMHLASLTGTPVVSIWGATHPYAGFVGWGQKDSNILQADLPCRPCSIYGNKPCKRGDMECMHLISPESVIGKIEEITTDQLPPSAPHAL